MLLGLAVPFVSPVTAFAQISRGGHATSSFGTNSDQVTIESPTVTEADVDAGAILVAQVIAASDDSVSTIWICPIETGWTHVERVVDMSPAHLVACGYVATERIYRLHVREPIG